jgi:uncharacterized peroxidase-related enzyme
MTWIRTIDWESSEGQLRDAYDWQAASLGEPAEFTTLGSMYPDIVEERLRLYRSVENCPSSLSQIERQCAAWVASLLNGTAHCASGLKLKIASLGLDSSAMLEIERSPADAKGLEPRLSAICAHAAKLTIRPTEMAEADLEELRVLGLDDLDIVDLNNMVSYYNYINRVVMGLGLRSVMSTTHEATKAVPDATADEDHGN